MNVLSNAAACHAAMIVLPKMYPITFPLVLNVASLETTLNTLHKRCWNRGLELRKIAGVDLSRKPQCSINNRRIKRKEILCNAAGSWILGVQARDTDLRRALKVLLEVDAALGKHGALELRQGGIELGCQAVLEHEAGLDAPICGNGEEFGCARVDMRCIEAARVEEEDRRRETEISQDREIGSVR